MCWICVHCAVTENDMLRLLLNVLRNASSRWVTNSYVQVTECNSDSLFVF